MEPLERPYLGGKPPAAPVPLARYLPPLNEGIASSWLAEQFHAGAWILDPFGASPPLALETARQGYRVLVAANNPITSFMLEVLASAPTENDLRAALADLGDARKGDERLEVHLQSLYAVECSQCHQTIQADSFMWQKDAATPQSCQVSCPHCGFTGEQAVSSGNLERLASLGKGGLHRSRALERVIGREDPIRPHVELALNCYQLRPLYALITLINRLESLGLPAERERLAKALILLACDEGNTLWPSPSSRHRPRQLVVPSSFRENNLWISLENAIDIWHTSQPPLPLTLWPELPPENGGICLYKGRLRELSVELNDMDFKGVLTAFPRPNQAFWTLSAVWAGWLWGREAVAPLRSALSRQRYDWSWHATALATTLESLRPHLHPDTSVLGLISEAEAPFALASLWAADQTGFDLQGYALRVEPAQFQLYWKPKSPYFNPAAKPAAVDSLQTHLQHLGEPAPYLPLYFLSSLAALQAGFPKEKPSTPVSGGTLTIFSQFQEKLQKKLLDSTRFSRFGGSAQSPEHAQFWPAGETPYTPCLTDRVEMNLYQWLQQPAEHTLLQGEQVLCQAFPGLLTPSQELIEAVLASYGQNTESESSLWQLREEDAPAARRQEIQQLSKVLHELGKTLGFIATGKEAVLWSDAQGQVSYRFYLLASAVISPFVFSSDTLPKQSVLVIPGSRVGLLNYKLRHNPLLNDTLSQGWRFLKFRQLRQMAGSLFMDKASWEELLKADPIIT